MAEQGPLGRINDINITSTLFLSFRITLFTLEKAKLGQVSVRKGMCGVKRALVLPLFHATHRVCVCRSHLEAQISHFVGVDYFRVDFHVPLLLGSNRNKAKSGTGSLERKKKKVS